MRRFTLLWICVYSLIAMPITAQDDPPIDSEQPQPTLTIWLPAPLFADELSEANELLMAHTDQFTLANDVAVEYRIKSVGAVGGIMSTIRSGSGVAPGSLPDVALIRRIDLTSAQAPVLLQSLENLFSTALINDLNTALSLGQIAISDERNLYGLPYFVEFLHAVSTQPIDSGSNLTFDTILDDSATFLLPAGRASGLNPIFFLQYLATGGSPPRNGIMIIDENALQTVLEFYEDAIENETITSDVLDYNSPSAYRTEFMNAMDELVVGIFSSSEYLSMQKQDSSLQPAHIPTDNGNTITTLNGWVWVLVSPDPTQQDLSIRYLNWMMQPEFHAELSTLLNQLPTQQSAIIERLPDTLTLEFVNSLFAHAVLPLAENESSTVLRAMEDALIKVLIGDTTAEEATQQVIAQFATD